MVRQSAAPRFFARKQLHKIIISLPEKESMTKGLPRGLNMAQTYAEIIKPGGLLFALSKHELPMESFAAAFDAASDQWHRLDDAQWRKDPFGDLLIHAGSEHYAVNANIAVWKRKSSGYESFVERGRTLRRS